MRDVLTGQPRQEQADRERSKYRMRTREATQERDRSKEALERIEEKANPAYPSIYSIAREALRSNQSSSPEGSA